ncbi:MAG: cell division protein ZapA [Candidatus Firestonebacteria bacterium]|nr:cell division protein ZapA [Candidatus Firestonebacteria bacterium]
MEENNNGVCVDIFGSEYVIKGDGNSDYTKEIANYVDSKMKEISINTSNVSSLKVAILTALNLADEIYKLKKEKVVSDITKDKIEALVQVMEGQGL